MEVDGLVVPEEDLPAGEPPMDGDPVLPGEDPRSTDPGDVEHWVAVYGELLEGVRAALHEDGDGTDPLLREMTQRYVRRMRFWRERQRGSRRRSRPPGA